MGWSIDLVKDEISAIFRNLDTNYEIQHPDSNYPAIYLTYDKDIPLGVMKYIATLFPDDVYIYFMKSTFPVEKPL
jgi:hypothetical protein